VSDYPTNHDFAPLTEVAWEYRVFFRSNIEEKMDEIKWSFHRINWTLYLDDAGLWMAFSSASQSHQTTDKGNMESWLGDHGLRAEDIQTLIRDVEKNGEAAITVSHLHQPPD
jgi:hypothetical protein